MAANEERASFALDLEGNAKEHAEEQGAALERLRDKIAVSTEALGGMQRALRNLKGGGNSNLETMKALKDKIAAQKAVIAGAQQSYIDLGGSFAKLKPSGPVAALEALLGKIRGAPGPVGALSGKLGPLLKMLGTRVLVAAGIVAGIALLVGATIAAVGALASYGIAQADARRNELLRLEGLTKIRYFMGGIGQISARAADSATFLQGAIDRVSNTVALGRGEVSKYTEQLYMMGLRGRNLSDALEGMSIVGATQGDAQAQRFANWAAGAAMTGQSVRRLSDDVKARLGGIAARQMLSLSVISEKLHENLGQLFDGLKLEGLGKAVSTVTALFSQSTVTGKALKVICTTILQPLINAAEYAGPIVKRFFQGLVLGALYLIIAVLKVRKWWRETFGDSKTLEGLNLQKIALYAGIGAVLAFGVALAAAGLAALVLLSPLLLVGFAIYAIYKVIKGAVTVLEGIGAAFAMAGKAMVDGLIGGIMGGGPGVMATIRNMGKAAVTAFKQTLGIASPSKITMGIGYDLGRGKEIGIERSTPRVAAAARRMSYASMRAMAPANDNALRFSARASASASARGFRARAGFSASIGARPRLVTPIAPRAPEPAPQPFGRYSAPPAPKRPRSGGGSPIHVTLNLTINAASGKPDDIKAAVVEALGPALEQLAAELGAKRSDADEAA